MAGKPQSQKNVFDRLMQAFAKTKIGGKLFVTVFPAIDKVVMPLTRGKVRVGVGQPVLLLHHVGAKSRQPRTTPLLYVDRGDDVVLVASKAGSTSHPAWYHNVRATPDVEIELDGARRSYRIREAEGPERDELWRLANDIYNGYDVYQQRAGDRRIPVLVAEPQA